MITAKLYSQQFTLNVNIIDFKYQNTKQLLMLTLINTSQGVTISILIYQ